MSTNINITVGGNSLVDQAKAQQQAARQAQLEKENNAALEDEAAQQRAETLAAQGRDATGTPEGTGNPPGTATGNPLEKSDVLLDEPAAYRFSTLNLGHAWLVKTPTEITTNTGIRSVAALADVQIRSARTHEIGSVLIGCGNGSSWVTVPADGIAENPGAPAGTLPVGNVPATVTMLGPNNNLWQNYWHVLPAGNSTFILTTATIYFYNNVYLTGQVISSNGVSGSKVFNTLQSVSVTKERGVELRTFVCNNTAIREIARPQVYSDLLEETYPLPTTTTVFHPGNAVNPVWPGNDVTYEAYTFATPTLGLFTSEGIGHSTPNSLGYSYSPDIYKRTNDASQFTSPTRVKTIPTSYKRSMIDASSGGYALNPQTVYPLQTIYAAGQPLKYAIWPIPNQEPDLDAWDAGYAGPRPIKNPKATLNFSDSRPTRDEEYERFDLAVASDWGDPNYCRARLFDLGFTSADLRP